MVSSLNIRLHDSMNLWNLVKIGAQVVFLVLVIARERDEEGENGRETKDATRRGGAEDRTEGMKENTPDLMGQREGYRAGTQAADSP